ncbi:MAG: ATP-binding protein [Thaumarchaeota archaeon]|jgi:SpoVK/Ycf46/Vps4 family AAA+-type ATPase|nr:ATP-binding protein [Nitrososphaerota archaeon]MCL7386551.1 ATP-binding protein [Candidatus Wolframiiraptor allenii]
MDSEKRLEDMKELERLAAEKARAAVKYDKIGMREEAAKRYREAIALLEKLIELTDDPVMRRIYEEKQAQYRRRIEALSEKVSVGGRSEEQAETDESFIIQNPPPVKWDDVIGLEQAKKAILESIIYPMKRPDLFPLGWPRGILLFGPPGCGKTMLAAAVANEIDAVFMHVDASLIMSKWLGESERNIAKIFNTARKYESTGKPVIIFIDEVDSLAAVRLNEVGGEARARNQLIKEMDGLLDKGRKSLIYILAATNKPWLLDEPFIRRFQKRVYIGLPNYEARLRLFQYYAGKLNLDNVDFAELARITEGYSAADIYSICVEVQTKIVSEFFEQGGDEPRKITMEDFLEVIRSRRPSVDPKSIEKMLEWYERFGAL